MLRGECLVSVVMTETVLVLMCGLVVDCTVIVMSCCAIRIYRVLCNSDVFREVKHGGFGVGKWLGKLGSVGVLFG